MSAAFWRHENTFFAAIWFTEHVVQNGKQIVRLQMNVLFCCQTLGENQIQVIYFDGKHFSEFSVRLIEFLALKGQNITKVKETESPN